MSLDVIQSTEVIEALENFIAKRRPAEEIRGEVDLSYKIEQQSVIIYEIRQRFDNPDEYFESPIAKTTWVHSQGVWKIFWMRSDLKWHSYDVKSKVKKIQEFIKIVDEDAYGCFWG